jgi:hypothetical protein
MGPYYVTAMVNLLGPVRTVVSQSRVGSAIRPVFTPGRTVEEIHVEVPTHSSAVLTFESGTIATVLMSFDIWNHELPQIELYGALGALSMPDPDKYDNHVRLRLNTDEQWQTVSPVIAPLTAGLSRDQLPLRGPGVADLAAALDGPVPAGLPIDEGIFELQGAYFRRTGTGVVDWFGWSRLLRDIGYHGCTLLELDAVEDPITEMTRRASSWTPPWLASTPRQPHERWQREVPMQLWQLDITGSVFLTDGTELKLISGIDDHSRFCVIATVDKCGARVRRCCTGHHRSTAYTITVRYEPFARSRTVGNKWAYAG